MIRDVWPFAYRSVTGARLALAAIVAACSIPLGAGAADACAPFAARVVSLQGSVEVRRPSASAWQPIALNEAICAGDMVRVGERSRAGLLLPNETTLRLDQNTTLTVAPAEKEKATLLQLLQGTINAISRTPQPFGVQTPFVNANIKGTEFLVGVTAESARVAVFEGAVTAQNDRGRVEVGPGEQAVADRNQPPRKQIVVRPRDAVQWALYFPTVFDTSVAAALASTTAQAAVRDSVELYRKGRIDEAIARLEGVPDLPDSPRLLTYRAGLLLLVGRLDQAGPDIERALALADRDSDALSLQAVIAVVQDNKAAARKLAQQAVEASPQSAAARLALSYAQQSEFKIEDALASVRRAVDLDPNNALAWARLAELEMSVGERDRALTAAKRAQALDPELARTQIVVGFANLVRVDTRAAKAAFGKAIELDSTDPLARLGLGLAQIRGGDLQGGREQIEVAVSLDPSWSLGRSYLGKAYYEEKREKLAGTQLGLAQQLDPKDPTPWFYDAIRKQTENRPVEALGDLERSIDLNDNRAVYRSQLLVDQDLAARSADLARIYRDLAFEQLALIEAYKSVETDPADYSAHQFLAEAYLDQPRQEIAQVSELLQSQLRQPLSIVPLQPQFGDSTPFVLAGAGPARPGFNEFGSLFNRNQNAFQFSGIAGGNETIGDQFVASGIHDNLSYSVGQLHFDTAGFRQNNDLHKDIVDAFAQSEINPDTSLQMELRHEETSGGDLALRFDPNNFTPTSRTHDITDTIRLGGRYVFSPNLDFIVSPIFQEARGIFNLGDPSFPFSFTNKDRSTAVELQSVYRAEGFHFTVGAGHYLIASNFEILGAEQPNPNGSDTNVYGYGHVKLLPHLAIDLGLSYERLRALDVRRSQWNPKFGLIWSPLPATTIRAAAFQVVKRQFVTDQTVEPTEVAGFNQFFDDLNGAVSKRFGGAIDQRLSADLHAGVEISARVLEKVPFTFVGEFEWLEQERGAYVYWAPTRSLAVTARYQYEHFERPVDFTGDEQIIEVRTHRVPLGVSFFSPGGVSARVNATFVNQTGSFDDVLGNPFAGSQRFWVLDASVGYRLPRRVGVLTVDGRNLLDRTFRFQETDRAMPSVALRRVIFAKWTLAL